MVDNNESQLMEQEIKENQKSDARVDEDVTQESSAEKPPYFVRLKEKWKLKSMTQLVLILITFSIGGSACGALTGKFMSWTSMSVKSPLWWITYIILATIIWPICVYIISFFFGQQKFFKSYLNKMWNRMTKKK